MTTAVYAYPWNLHQPDADVARIRQMGVDEVSLAVSYHAGKFIQPGDPAARVHFPEDGAIYFRPRRSYGDLQPQVARVTQERDVLAELCERGDIGVNAWTVLNHNTRLGLLHPDITVRNAFGDAYPYSLCPANPKVRAYGVTLCADLADTYAVKSLLLETPGYLTYGHGYHHEFAQVAPSAWLDAMLGLCFCRHCRDGATAAGIDADGLAARIRTAVDLFLDGDTPEPPLDTWNAGDPDLGVFHDWRCGVVTSLVAVIRAAVRPTVKVKVIATCQRPHATAYLEGHDLVALDAVSDGLELPLYQSSPAAVITEATYVTDRVAAGRTSAILRPGYPDLVRGEDLEAALAGLKALGVTDVAFYNLGLLRPVNLRRLSQALDTQDARARQVMDV